MTLTRDKTLRVTPRLEIIRGQDVGSVLGLGGAMFLGVAGFNIANGDT